MQLYNFSDVNFLNKIGVQAEEIIDKVKNEILNHPKFKILKSRYIDVLWQERVNKNNLFTIVIEESFIESLDFKKIKQNISKITDKLRVNNIVEVNHEFDIIKSSNINFSSSKEAKNHYKKISKEKKIVFFFGKQGVDVVIKGENIEETNIFYCNEDVTRYHEKRDITQIHEVMNAYQREVLSLQHSYMYFFAEISNLNALNIKSDKKNILKNKPEKYMRDHIRNFLSERMPYTFSIEIELLGSKKKLDIYTEVNGEFYFFEIKWLGHSISNCGTKLSDPYGDWRARDGVTQSLGYVKELIEVMNINVKCGYLVIFDARETEGEIDYKDYEFLSDDLRRYQSHFEIMKPLRLINKHPA